MKTVQNMKGPARAAGTCKMGIHKDAFSLYTGPRVIPQEWRREDGTPYPPTKSGRRKGKVTVTVDPKRVAAAFAASRDTNASRTSTLVTARPDQIRPSAAYVDPQGYSLVILPNSKSIQR